MKTLGIHFIGLFLLLLVSTAYSQDNWFVQLRPKVNHPTKDVGSAELKTGFGFEAAVGYRIVAHLGAYVGWGWNKFASVNSSFAGNGDTDFEETGYTFGMQFIHPIRESSISYLIRAGGVYNHIEVEYAAGNITADTGHGLGLEVGAGINVDLGGFGILDRNWVIVHFQGMSTSKLQQRMSTSIISRLA